MNKTLTTLIFALITLIGFGQTADELNKQSIDKFIPTGYSILFQGAGDLNLDGITDKILILRKNGEDTLSTIENPVKRKLLILSGQQDKSFKLESENDNVIYFYGYDLNFKDAFVDLIIKPGQFSVDHYGGFAQRWGRTTTFKYNTADKTFYLAKDEFSTFDATDEKKTTKEKIHTEKDFGKVTVDKFDIYKKWE
jgi:hypothetical protein